jgi:hypothetical protein
MKIITTKLHRKDQSIIINDVTVTFNKDLEAEVSEQDFKIISAYDASIKPAKDKKDTGKDKDKSKDSTSNEDNANSNKTTLPEKDVLLGMKIKELVEICEEAQLPKTEWEGFKRKSEFADYIVKNIK